MMKARFRQVIAVMIIALGLGMLWGLTAGPPESLLRRVGLEGLLAIESEPEVFLPQRDTRVLADFEHAGELNLWRLRGAVITQSDEHASNAMHSGRFEFLAGTGSRAALFRDYFRTNIDAVNWNGYSWLVMEVYNPAPRPARFIIEIKDISGRIYKEEFYPESQVQEEFRIRLEDLMGLVDLGHIAQFSLFRWQPKEDAFLYVDYIRLLTDAFPSLPEPEAPPHFFRPAEPDAIPQPIVSAPAPEASPQLQIGVETSLRKVFRNPDVFHGEWGEPVRIKAARGEAESAQIVLQAGRKGLRNVQFSITDLVSDVDFEQKIEQSRLSLRAVGYVTTTKPGYPVSFVGDWPDPLLSEDSFDLKENELQPLWLTVRVPHGMPAGDYVGSVKLSWEGGSQTVPVLLEVWDFDLPAQPALQTAFDFYLNRLESAYRDFLPEAWERWKVRMPELAEIYYETMLEYKMSPIMNLNPSDSDYIPRMKRYAELGLNAVAVGEYGGSFDNHWPDDLEIVTQSFQNYSRTLEAFGWTDISYVYTYDEPPFGKPEVAEAARAVHKGAPRLRNLICMQHMQHPQEDPKWFKDIDIVCIRNVTFKDTHAQSLRDMGKELWLYVSGPSPPYPTYVIDFPAVAYRVIPWMCWKYDIKGLLFWCVNYWKRDPWVTTQNTDWEQNSNGILFYPGPNGPVPTIRAEVIRDGIEDYDYLALLHKLLKRIEALESGVVPENLLQAAQSVGTVNESIAYDMKAYTRSPLRILERREEIAHAILWAQKVLGD